ncbi:unnamed protein product, partial [Closterium sp. Naga37s-1]
DYEFVTIDLSKGEQKSAEFKKKQPFGVIPVLEDEDVELFESRAIARYVADKYAEQGTNLLGSTLKERALVNLWLEVESQNYNPPISGLIAEKIFKPRKGLATDEAKVAEYKAKLSQVLDVPSLSHSSLSHSSLSHSSLSHSSLSHSSLSHSSLSHSSLSHSSLSHSSLSHSSLSHSSLSHSSLSHSSLSHSSLSHSSLSHSSLSPSSLSHACFPPHAPPLRCVGNVRPGLPGGAAAVIGLDRRTDAKALEVRVCVVSAGSNTMAIALRGAAAVIGLAGQEDRRQGTGRGAAAVVGLDRRTDAKALEVRVLVTAPCHVGGWVQSSELGRCALARGAAAVVGLDSILVQRDELLARYQAGGHPSMAWLGQLPGCTVNHAERTALLQLPLSTTSDGGADSSRECKESSRGHGSSTGVQAPVLALDLSALQAVGRHNAENAAVAALLCLALGMESSGVRLDGVQIAVKVLQPPPHRMELVVVDGQDRAWINDSKATNVEASTAGIEGLGDESTAVILLGGIAKV